MSPQPFSHHEILDLVEPFARRGRHVDLAASDRLERRLVFTPAGHDRDDLTAPPRETLTLDNPAPGTWRLTRRLQLRSGARAALHAEGRDVALLLERIEAIDTTRQWRSGPGYEIAWTQRIEADKSGGAPQLVTTNASAQVDGLTLRLRVPAVRQLAADLDIEAGASDGIELPQDLLAVLGWHWARLRRVRSGWTSKLRVGRREPDRSRQAEARFERSVAHVARTLAEPPARFHPQWRGARWGVVLRRAIPLLTFVALIGAAFALPKAMAAAPDMRLWVMVFHAPLLLLAASLSLQELSQVEVPPLPRPLRAAAWRKPAASAAKDSTPHETTLASSDSSLR